MKNTIFIVVLTIFVAACSKPAVDEKKTQLDALRKEQKALNLKIAQLEKETGQDAASNAKVKLVAVEDVKGGDFKHFIEIQGKIDSKKNVNMSAQMPGVVTAVYVREGDYVGAGQVIGMIDAGVMNQQLQEMRGRLTLATTFYDRQKALWEQKVGTEIQFLQAKNNRESIELSMATLQQQMTKTAIVSSIAGTVENVYMKVGEAAMPGAPGVRVVNMSDVRAVADVAERYAGSVKVGSDVIVYLPDTKREIKGKIVFFSQVIDPMTRSFKVEVAIPIDATIRPNMVTIVKIVDYQTGAAMTVPINTIQSDEKHSFVLVASEENGKKIVRKKIVEVGQIYNRLAEIKTGLAGGEKLITVGYQDLNDGDLIKF
jgi:membrane fusion protein, multidrug efflux system